MAPASPKYSVCITSYNKGENVRTSLKSLFLEIDDRFEVVVTDNFSNDGSEMILREYARDGAIRLLEASCTRGLGREIAFEGSRGEYIISGIDTDDFVVQGRLSLLLDFYHKECEGYLLRVMESGIVVAPAHLLRSVGGWRDLQFSENWDIAERAARISRYVWTIFRAKGIIGKPDSVSVIRKNLSRYRKYLDWLRVGRRPFHDEKPGIGMRIDYALAKVSLLYYGRLNPVPPIFDDCDPKHFIDSSEWWHRSGQDDGEEIKWYRRHSIGIPAWSDPAKGDGSGETAHREWT